MRKYRLMFPVLSLFLLLFSCIKEHPDYDSPECNDGSQTGDGSDGKERMIVVKFDWSLVGEPANTEKIDLLITDEDTDEVTEMYVTYSGTVIELDTHTFEFVGNEEHPNVILERCTVTVDKDASGNYYEPQYFAAGSIEQTIDPDLDYQEVVIPMRRQTRPLVVRVVVNGEGVDYLDYITGEISGITMSRLVNDGFPPLDGLDSHPAFLTASVEYDLLAIGENIYNDTHNLLGVDSNSSQVLDLTIYFSDGYSQLFTIDVTDRMVGFHTVEVNEPWVLEFVINLGSTGESIEVTIENWYGGSESHLVVN